MKISKEDFDRHFKDFDVKQEVGDMSKQITTQLAEEYLIEWRQAQQQVNSENTDLEAGSTRLLDGLNSEELLLKQKDKLFINTGEDVEDIFAAFKYYKLNYE